MDLALPGAPGSVSNLRLALAKKLPYNSLFQDLPRQAATSLKICFQSFLGPRAPAMAPEAPSPAGGWGEGKDPNPPLSPIMGTPRAQEPKGPKRASS